MTTPTNEPSAPASPPSAPIENAAAIRKRGLRTLGIGVGGVVLARILVELQILFEVDAPMLGGTMVVIFPVVAAFGLTSAILGSEGSLLRLPLVVVLAIALIGVAFFVVIPAGYALGR